MTIEFIIVNLCGLIVIVFLLIALAVVKAPWMDENGNIIEEPKKGKK
jgi:hypothetical protein